MSEKEADIVLKTLESFPERASLPDAFRMRYRNLIIQIIAEIVRLKMNKQQAIEAIRQKALHEIPEDDRLRFIEIVERELQNIHEGSIARYRIRPLEFESWKARDSL